MLVIVSNTSGQSYEVNCGETSTWFDVKKQIFNLTNILPEHQCLTLYGKPLLDGNRIRFRFGTMQHIQLHCHQPPIVQNISAVEEEIPLIEQNSGVSEEKIPFDDINFFNTIDDLFIEEIELNTDDENIESINKTLAEIDVFTRKIEQVSGFPIQNISIKNDVSNILLSLVNRGRSLIDNRINDIQYLNEIKIVIDSIRDNLMAKKAKLSEAINMQFFKPSSQIAGLTFFNKEPPADHKAFSTFEALPLDLQNYISRESQAVRETFGDISVADYWNDNIDHVAKMRLINNHAKETDATLFLDYEDLSVELKQYVAEISQKQRQKLGGICVADYWASIGADKKMQYVDNQKEDAEHATTQFYNAVFGSTP